MDNTRSSTLSVLHRNNLQTPADAPSFACRNLLQLPAQMPFPAPYAITFSVYPLRAISAACNKGQNLIR